MIRYLILTFSLVLSISLIYAGFSLDIESGVVFPGYNDVRIPNDEESTKFSLTEDLEADPVFSYRVNLHYRLNERHRISFLYAPLEITPQGRLDRLIYFQGETFPHQEMISALYRFDSYRLQYRYYFANQDLIIKGIGATAKLRHAEISLAWHDGTAKKTDTGVVPLINFLFSYDINPQLSILLDGEGLFSQFGRAADILAAFNYRVDERFSLRAGYRILEGGSDIDEVYTFALFNYAVIGLGFGF